MTVSTLKPRLDHEHVRELLKGMIRIRRFEDKCAELYSKRKFVVSCTCMMAKRPLPRA